MFVSLFGFDFLDPGILVQSVFSCKDEHATSSYAIVGEVLGDTQRATTLALNEASDGNGCGSGNENWTWRFSGDGWVA